MRSIIRLQLYLNIIRFISLLQLQTIGFSRIVQKHIYNIVYTGLIWITLNCLSLETTANRAFKSDLESSQMRESFIGFQVLFKCMSGSTTKNGKFIRALNEKLTYDDSIKRCKRNGLKIYWNSFQTVISDQMKLLRQ